MQTNETIEIGTAIDIPDVLAGRAAILADTVGLRASFSKRHMLAGPNDLFDLFCQFGVWIPFVIWANEVLKGAAGKFGEVAAEKLMARFTRKMDDPDPIGKEYGANLDKLIVALNETNERRAAPWELRLGLKTTENQESREAILFQSAFSDCTNYREFFAQYIFAITSIGPFVEAAIVELSSGQLVPPTFTGEISLNENGTVDAKLKSSEMTVGSEIRSVDIYILQSIDGSTVINIDQR